jgi:hypothetical protein
MDSTTHPVGHSKPHSKFRISLFPAACKPEFVQFHVYPAATKSHSFGLQPQALFNRGIATKLDLAASSQNPMPGQPMRTMQRPGDLPCGSRIPGGSGDCAIAGNFT